MGHPVVLDSTWNLGHGIIVHFSSQNSSLNFSIESPPQSCQNNEAQIQSQKCSTPDIRLDPPSSDESSVRTPDNNALGECCQMAKFDPFLSLDCARVVGVGAQSKERKGSNFAAQRSGAIVQKPEGPNTYDLKIWL